ncbi:MAG: hypothetical protein Q8M07_31530 [Prosthecobacter sp.]|nr:hypothetical protein [Prosthecobacter sp.]
MTPTPELIASLCKAYSAGYQQGLSGTHQEVPPIIDSLVDDAYRHAFRIGAEDALEKVKAGKGHAAELKAAEEAVAVRWKHGAECALDQVTRLLPYEEAAALAELNARTYHLFTGTPYCDGYSAVMMAADGLAQPVLQAQQEFYEILRLADQGHARLDAAGVPAYRADPAVGDRSLVALIHRLGQTLPLCTPMWSAPTTH